MAYTITIEQVAARPIAGVRARMAVRDIPTGFRKPLDTVRAFLGRHPELRADGLNVFLYRHDMDGDGAMTIDFGVEVARAFEADGDVICATTPAGEVATTLHHGSYAGLGAAHAAVHAWLKQSGRSDGGWSWEIYGDWSDDPAKLETRIFYLLR